MQMTQGNTNPAATETTEMTKRLRLPHLRRNFRDLSYNGLLAARQFDQLRSIGNRIGNR